MVTNRIVCCYQLLLVLNTTCERPSISTWLKSSCTHTVARHECQTSQNNDAMEMSGHPTSTRSVAVNMHAGHNRCPRLLSRCGIVAMHCLHVHCGRTVILPACWRAPWGCRRHSRHPLAARCSACGWPQNAGLFLRCSTCTHQARESRVVYRAAHGCACSNLGKPATKMLHVHRAVALQF